MWPNLKQIVKGFHKDQPCEVVRDACREGLHSSWPRQVDGQGAGRTALRMLSGWVRDETGDMWESKVTGEWTGRVKPNTVRPDYLISVFGYIWNSLRESLGRKLVWTLEDREEGFTLGRNEQRQEREARMVGNSTTCPVRQGFCSPVSTNQTCCEELHGRWWGQRQRSLSLISFV